MTFWVVREVCQDVSHCQFMLLGRQGKEFGSWFLDQAPTWRWRCLGESGHSYGNENRDIRVAIRIRPRVDRDGARLCYASVRITEMADQMLRDGLHLWSGGV